MQVRDSHLANLTAQIESMDPADGSILINSQFYQWLDCQELVADLSGGFVSPVPTLSQWVLIVTAGLLELIDYIVIRRRQLISYN